MARSSRACSGLETAITDLHAQMLASSELIKALADQNAQLIKRIEFNRVRWLWLAAAVALCGCRRRDDLGLVVDRETNACLI